MNRLIRFAAVGEAAFGVGLLVVPSIVGQLLIGERLTGAAVLVARVTGMALVGLGAACWPGPATFGLLIYSATVTVYLAYLGLAGAARGALLWPAALLHLVLTVLLIRASSADRRRASRGSAAGRAAAGRHKAQGPAGAH
jgi:hypothetical protein